MEEFILTLLCWFSLHSVFLGVMTITQQYLLWKRECKNILSMASKNYCMCGGRIDQHTFSDGHCPISEYEWAVNNLPELKLG